MGILNINDDSFSGDGTLDQDQARLRAETMWQQGAEIIDVGAESARTNREPISIAEEIARLQPFIAWFEAWRGKQENPPLLSINTWRPEVAREVMPLGGDMLNDMGALPDAQNAEICAATGAALLIMHSVGLPKQSHKHVGYADVMQTLCSFFKEKIQLATAAGCHAEQLLLDPGVDFAKQHADNLRIYRELPQLSELRRPILLPISRKSVIKHTLGIQDPQERDAGTVASLVNGVLQGAHIFRVHNVSAMADALEVIWAIQAPA
jgi:dihydropteroate synthase